MDNYLREVRRLLATGNTTEPSFYGALAGLLQSLADGVAATVQPRRIEAGAPDLVATRQGLVVGYVEAKDIGAPLDQAERSEQLRRYRRALDNLILTDYLEFRHYLGGELVDSARLGRLDADGKLKLDSHGRQETAQLLRGFLAHTPEPIADPRLLAERMAKLTHIVRDTIVGAFDRDGASDLMRDLRRAFAATLLPHLDQPEHAGEFADMYAQTIAYGLFAARCNHHGPGLFRRLGAAAEIPRTNPFLRQLFDTITGLQLDEEPYAPFVDELAQLLANADMETILAQFGRRTRQEDPVVHFYETFLAAYDPRLRELRGVYYTPEPVVSYIVRSVDHLLRERFGLAGGVATGAPVGQAETTGQAGTPAPTPTLPVGADASVRPPGHAGSPLLILDPACGTGTFLYAVVNLIREQFRQQGNAGLWPGYVREQLLPRLFGFELLMAPYAVAHLKLGMQLAAQDMEGAERRLWAYDLAAGDRLGIYLTNTLEQAERRVESLWGPLRAISEESQAAARVKRDLPIMVVLGNPPYSGHSANSSWEVRAGRRVPNFIGELVHDYYVVDGQPLGERNPKWLQDDYVKFIRWGQWRIEKTGQGILAFITNHGYLDNPTFRGMRQALMGAFSEVYLLDLHGNSKKKERAPDGGKDENVFDIQQGVAIGIFVKLPGQAGPARVYHADLWGERGEKYAALSEQDVSATEWRQLAPASAFYLFAPRHAGLETEYNQGWKLTDAMPVNALGFQTHRDDFAVAFSAAEIEARVAALRDPARSDDCLRASYGLTDNRDWQLGGARQQLRADSNWRRWLTQCLYRPFDRRACYFSEVAMDYPRRELLDHMLGRANLGLCVGRQGLAVNDPEWALITVASEPVDANAFRRGGATVFPLYLYPTAPQPGRQTSLLRQSHWPAGPGGRVPNLNPAFVAEMECKLGLRFVSDGAGDLTETFGPEDVFHYAYAVLHSPTYRERYAEFLKTDFPRLPLTADACLFRGLCALGRRLVGLHLLRPGAVGELAARFPVPGDNRVERGYPKYLAPGEPEPGSGRPLDDGRVYINRQQHFAGVPEEVWEFHIGGYQVCEKWLKDRRERVLSYDDLEHYREVVASLGETIRVMGEIDELIPGWPLA